MEKKKANYVVKFLFFFIPAAEILWRLTFTRKILETFIIYIRINFKSYKKKKKIN